MHHYRGLAVALILLVASLILVVSLRTAGRSWSEHRPLGIMGTDVRLRCSPHSPEALQAGEDALRRVEMLMSPWIELAPLARFNQDPAGTQWHLDHHSAAVIAQAHTAFAATQGTFDATIGPLLDLWREAAAQNAHPDADALAAARTLGSWQQIRYTEGVLHKLDADARLDLGGIAKGYAIDLAVTAMRAQGAEAGLVDVGGDIRVFGPGPRSDERWRIAIAQSDGNGILAILGLRDLAVVTSGNYQRFFLINDQRYSHIIDPRSGLPTDAAPSVTVIAEQAIDADVWATALSILGPAGLELLPAGMQAMIASQDDSGALQIFCSPGMSQLFLRPPEQGYTQLPSP